MLDLFGATLHIGCSTGGLAVLRRDRFGRPIGVPQERSLRAAPGSIELLASQLHDALAAVPCQRAVTTITLSDDWCRLFIVTPPANATHRRDCEAALGMRFQQLYGGVSEDWILQADWHIDRPFLAAALPRTLHAALLQVGVEYKLRLIALVAHSVSAWNRWHAHLQQGDWFGVAHDDMLSLVAIDAGALRAVRRESLTQEFMHHPDWLSDCVEREALRLNLPLPRQMRLCGEVPQPWTIVAEGRLPCLTLRGGKSAGMLDRRSTRLCGSAGMKALRIDFAAPSLSRMLANTSAMTWSIGVLALVALALAGSSARTLMQQHTTRQLTLQALTRLQQERMIPLPRAKEPAMPTAQVSAINGTIEQLNLPWRDLLDAIESATPASIALLALEPDARKHVLKGMAEAKDSAAMIDYIATLQLQPLFGSVALTRHEINEQDARKPLRFQFEAQWQTPASPTAVTP